MTFPILMEKCENMVQSPPTRICWRNLSDLFMQNVKHDLGRQVRTVFYSLCGFLQQEFHPVVCWCNWFDVGWGEVEWGLIMFFRVRFNMLFSSYATDLCKSLVTCSWCYRIGLFIELLTCSWCYTMHFLKYLLTFSWCYVPFTVHQKKSLPGSAPSHPQIEMLRPWWTSQHLALPWI